MKDIASENININLLNSSPIKIFLKLITLMLSQIIF
jgi:hypothetical protein